VDAYSISKCKEITLKAPQAKQEDNAVPKSSELLGQLQKKGLSEKSHSIRKAVKHKRWTYTR
jgi:hypothetical protein